MKCGVVRALLIAMFAGMFVTGLAQKNYYVVVGAFSTEGNAKDLTSQLPNFNADTAYSMTNRENVVHLYVLRTESEESAKIKSQQLQKTLESDGVAGNLETIIFSAGPEGRSVVMRKQNEIAESSNTLSDPSTSHAIPGGASAPTAPMVPKGKLFRFTISDPKGTTLPGQIHYVDFAREQDLAAYQTQDYTDILNPGKNREMSLVCGVFGYKQNEKFLDYGNPSKIEGAYEDENGAWVIPYKLERLTRGDVSVMYNVSFHKDAAIMLPPSQADLDELVKMMRENPNYEITIHGHCNGKNDRKIITTARGGKYFETTGARQFYGSAKELTELRAEAIRDYLLKKGIDEKRIRTYAWGGRYMLVKPDNAHARLNDRIEIEIRKD